MDEHEDSKKQATDKSTVSDTGPPIRWVKRKLSGKIPDTKRDCNGDLYIVAEYDEKNGSKGDF
jgi:hypothetical protein